MSKNDYKKRAKSGWRQGKAYKGDREERAYVKKEIKQELAKAEDPILPYKKSKRTRNEKARLEYRIKWCEEVLARYKSYGGIAYRDSFSSYLRASLAKAKAEYEKKFGKPK